MKPGARLAHLKAILEGFDGYIYLCSKDFRVAYMNARLIERTGRDATGELCYKALHDLEAVCPWCVNARVFAGETVRWEVQSPKDKRWLYVMNTPLRQRGEIVYKQSMFIDITERKKLEQELQEAHDRLETRVGERTAELEQANHVLQKEIRERMRAQKALGESERTLRRLSANLIKVQEMERRRVSLELHDELGQSLALLKLRIRSLEIQLRKDQTALRNEIDGVMLSVDRIIESVRRLSRDLSPAILEDLGLAAAVRNLAREFAPHFSVEIDSEPGNWDAFHSPEAQILIFRILQEAFNNILRHAKAHRVRLWVRREGDRLVVGVEDDGKGFNPSPRAGVPPSRRGLGLTTMAERVRMLGGSMTVDGRPGEGTVLTFSLPIEEGT